VSCGQFREAGFEATLVHWLDIGELNSKTTIALSSDAINHTACRGKLVSRMCDPQPDSSGPIDGHLGFDKTPVQAQCANQSHFHSARVKIGEFDDAAQIVSRCPASAEDGFRHPDILDLSLFRADENGIGAPETVNRGCNTAFLLGGYLTDWSTNFSAVSSACSGVGWP